LTKDLHSFIHIPKYKLRVEEDIVHNPFGRSGVHHCVGMPGEVPHQFMVIIAAQEASLKPSKLVPRVHLGHHQGDDNPMADTMKGDLLSVHRNILEAVHQ
jgi:hypothetical protein